MFVLSKSYSHHHDSYLQDLENRARIGDERECTIASAVQSLYVAFRRFNTLQKKTR